MTRHILHSDWPLTIDALEKNQREKFIDADTRKWLDEHYFRFLYTEIQGAIVYLNQSITWSIGVVTANVAFVVGSPLHETSIFVGLSVAVLGAVLLTHFLARGIRAYLNVMRYTTLTKNLTAARLGLYNNLNDWKQRDLSKIVDQIREYHVEWASPMSRISVIEKFIGEFGFGVLYSVIIIIISYFAFRSPFTIDPLLIIMDGFAAILCEFYFVLFHSSYFKKIGNFAIHP